MGGYQQRGHNLPITLHQHHNYLQIKPNNKNTEKYFCHSHWYGRGMLEWGWEPKYTGCLSHATTRMDISTLIFNNSSSIDVKIEKPLNPPYPHCSRCAVAGCCRHLARASRLGPGLGLTRGSHSVWQVCITQHQNTLQTITRFLTESEQLHLFLLSSLFWPQIERF